MKRIGTARRNTRHKLKKNYRQRGKIRISEFMKGFKEGDKVSLTSEPAYQKGMYHPRFYNKIGVITGNQGSCYKVSIVDRTKPKVLLVHPVHLKRI